MEERAEFLESVLDAITEHLAVIDSSGRIVYVNKSWIRFGQDNACVIDTDWSQQNYIEICDQASQKGDEFGQKASEGIRAVIAGKLPSFFLEYPCHSPNQMRWFMMWVTPLSLGTDVFYVISHQNITNRKLAEEEVRRLSQLDGLTGVANRRSFDEFLHNEWRRCTRLRQPLALAIVDLDHFKLLNDTYGHQSGDDCLIKVGQALMASANRPGDMCARYGGEEFGLIWSNTSQQHAEALAEQVLKHIRALAIPNENSPTAPYLTASIGVAVMYPHEGGVESDIVFKADKALYRAKQGGRNKTKT